MNTKNRLPQPRWYHLGMCSHVSSLLLLFSLFVLLLPGLSSAALVPIRVKAGTGLILMVEKYCTSKYHWKEIARINKLTPPYRLREGQEILIPEELLRAERVAGRIENVHGGVFFLDHAKNLRPAVAGDALLPGQTLVTREDGFAHIIFPDNRFVRVASDTRFSLTYMVRLVDNNLRAEFFLKKGKIVHTVGQRLKENESYQTRTPVAVTGVRGTEYRMKVADKGESVVETLKGVVAVDGSGRTQSVRSGEGTRVLRDAPPQKPRPLPAVPPSPEMQTVYRKLPVIVKAPRVEGAALLRLRISTDKEGNATILEKSVVPAENFTLLALPDDIYYGFLTAIGPDGLESPPAFPVRFQVRTIPGPPIFTQPYRGKVGFGTSRELVWMKDENAAHYHLLLASDENFSQILEDTVLDQTEYLAQNLKPGPYFVRVQAVAADGFHSLYSLTDSWKIQQQPTLGGLQPGRSDEKGLSFGWESMGAGITYDVQVGTSPKFSKLVVSEEGLVDSSYRIEKELESGSYYVRLRGVLGDGQKSPWSPPQILKIEQPPFSWKDGGVLMLFLGAALL